MLGIFPSCIFPRLSDIRPIWGFSQALEGLTKPKLYIWEVAGWEIVTWENGIWESTLHPRKDGNAWFTTVPLKINQNLTLLNLENDNIFHIIDQIKVPGVSLWI